MMTRICMEFDSTLPSHSKSLKPPQQIKIFRKNGNTDVFTFSEKPYTSTGIEWASNPESINRPDWIGGRLKRWKWLEFDTDYGRVFAQVVSGFTFPIWADNCRKPAAGRGKICKSMHNQLYYYTHHSHTSTAAARDKISVSPFCWGSLVYIIMMHAAGWGLGKCRFYDNHDRLTVSVIS